MQVDDGLLQVVCAIVEEGEHRGPDKLWTTLGQASRIHRTYQYLELMLL